MSVKFITVPDVCTRGAHRNRTIRTGRVPYYGSVPVPFRGRFNHWTDGGRDGLGPSKAVIVRPSRPYRRLDGCLQTFSRLLSLSLPGRRCAIHFKKPYIHSTRRQPPFPPQDRLHGLHSSCSCNACQRYSTVPNFSTLMETVPVTVGHLYLHNTLVYACCT